MSLHHPKSSKQIWKLEQKEKLKFLIIISPMQIFFFLEIYTTIKNVYEINDKSFNKKI